MRIAVIAAAIVASMSTGSFVGADEIGRAEYLAACAGCHGKEAGGNGPLAQNLSIDAPSLTGLSSKNDGDFPFAETIRVVDGRDEVRLHGSPMPIWGERFFSAAAVTEEEWDAEITTRGRLLSLVYYLESIQSQ